MPTTLQLNACMLICYSVNYETGHNQRNVVRGRAILKIGPS